MQLAAEATWFLTGFSTLSPTTSSSVTTSFTFNFQLCLTPHIASLCIVFPITLLTGFWLNKYVTFTHSTLHSARQLIRYILIVAVNLGINYFGLKLLVEHFGWYPTPSKICITLFTIIISFLGQKFFTFRR
ncbi:MAG: GtrA family protein [Paludibacteraceae bacterium]|nr:GtrA family protein [Paludibacteraceae bacterium]